MLAGLLGLGLALAFAVWTSFAWWKHEVTEDALCKAIASNDIVSARRLLEAGVSANTRFRESETGSQGNFSLSILLAMLAGKADRGELSGETVLMRAAYVRKPDIVELLLRHGARPNAVWSQTTALTVAARRGDHQSVDRLLRAGADPNLNPAGPAPLFYASSRNHLGVMELLLRSGAVVDACTSTGDTPLMAAAQNNQVAAVKRLLDAGANPARQNDHQQTAAGVARRAGAMAALKLITAIRTSDSQ